MYRKASGGKSVEMLAARAPLPPVPDRTTGQPRPPVAPQIVWGGPPPPGRKHQDPSIDPAAFPQAPPNEPPLEGPVRARRRLREAAHRARVITWPIAVMTALVFLLYPDDRLDVLPVLAVVVYVLAPWRVRTAAAAATALLVLGSVSAVLFWLYHRSGYDYLAVLAVVLDVFGAVFAGSYLASEPPWSEVAGARWVGVARGTTLHAVRIYELRSVSLGIDENDELRLHLADQHSALYFIVRRLQTHPELWALVYNGIRHFDAGAEIDDWTRSELRLDAAGADIADRTRGQLRLEAF